MYQKVYVTTVIRVRPTVNNYIFTRPFVSSHFSDGKRETLG